MYKIGKEPIVIAPKEKKEKKEKEESVDLDGAGLAAPPASRASPVFEAQITPCHINIMLLMGRYGTVGGWEGGAVFSPGIFMTRV